MLPADELTQWALSQIGVKWPSGAVFVQAAYNSVGIKLPSTSLAQAFRVGRRIDKSEISVGDIVFPRARVSQLAIGGGQVIGVTKRGVAKGNLPFHPWRVIRVTNPGGGDGLALAYPV